MCLAALRNRYAQVLCKRLRLAGELDFKAVAAKTPVLSELI